MVVEFSKVTALAFVKAFVFEEIEVNIHNEESKWDEEVPQLPECKFKVNYQAKCGHASEMLCCQSFNMARTEEPAHSKVVHYLDGELTHSGELIYKVLCVCRTALREKRN